MFGKNATQMPDDKQGQNKVQYGRTAGQTDANNWSRWLNLSRNAWPNLKAASAAAGRSIVPIKVNLMGLTPDMGSGSKYRFGAMST